ncbi:hypothetical protein GIB67_010704 [Kingdonia uniflora]|uniref:Aminotransferase-like plant mobile domain-containing protein n=1 Tax=Kingdonia uniflora TaxID=39325 RepID=A0A7J7L8V2_9MAGN|nr:hypothetical protein GIB67_010704 [Kingdonia uniflora]
MDFAHFPKLVGIPTEIDSDQYEHCTCWKWGESVTNRYSGPALLKFREVLDKYKVDDVVWNPYKDKMDYAHGFKEITYFYGALASLDHVQPYYPNRVVRQFSRKQGSPRKPLCPEVSKLWISEKPRKYNPKYEWADCFSEKKWKDYILKKAERGQRISQWNLLRESIDQLKEDIQLKRVLEEQCALAYTDLPAQLDAKLAIVQSHKPMTDINLTIKYDDLLSTHEELKKKLIAKENLVFFQCKKLVNTEEMKKSLKVNNNEWVVWSQSLKKALESEGMRDMRDPTFEELFEQNERSFTIAQQGPKGDYHKDLVSTAVTLENVVIARRDIMAKKKKIQ